MGDAEGLATTARSQQIKGLLPPSHFELIPPTVFSKTDVLLVTGLRVKGADGPVSAMKESSTITVRPMESSTDGCLQKSDEGSSQQDASENVMQTSSNSPRLGEQGSSESVQSSPHLKVETVVGGAERSVLLSSGKVIRFPESGVEKVGGMELANGLRHDNYYNVAASLCAIAATNKEEWEYQPDTPAQQRFEQSLESHYHKVEKHLKYYNTLPTKNPTRAKQSLRTRPRSVPSTQSQSLMTSHEQQRVLMTHRGPELCGNSLHADMIHPQRSVVMIMKNPPQPQSPSSDTAPSGSQSQPLSKKSQEAGQTKRRQLPAVPRKQPGPKPDSPISTASTVAVMARAHPQMPALTLEVSQESHLDVHVAERVPQLPFTGTQRPDTGGNTPKSSTLPPMREAGSTHPSIVSADSEISKTDTSQLQGAPAAESQHKVSAGVQDNRQMQPESNLTSSVVPSSQSFPASTTDSGVVSCQLNDLDETSVPSEGMSGPAGMDSEAVQPPPASSRPVETRNDTAIALVLQEEERREAGLPHAVPLLPRDPFQPVCTSDFEIARRMQQDYDAEMASVMQRQERGVHEEHGHYGHGRPLSYGDQQGSPPRRPQPNNPPHRRENTNGYSNREGLPPSGGHRLAGGGEWTRGMGALVASRPYPPTARQGGQGSGGETVDMSYEALSQLQDIPRGMNLGTITRITSTYKHQPRMAAGTQSLSDADKKCCICLLEFETGQELRTLPCFHSFHRICIDKWLFQQRQCPVCMEDVQDQAHRLNDLDAQ